MTLERIKQEEAELERQMFGSEVDQTEEVSTPTEENDEYSEETDATSVIHQETQDFSAEEPQEKQQRVSWKNRFINYKTTTDKTIFGLRKEVARLTAEAAESYKKVDEISAKLAALQSSNIDPFAEVITADDVLNVGEEAIDIVKKVAKKASEATAVPLQDEIKRLKAERIAEEKRRAEAEQKRAYGSFLSSLEELVPDYATINLDSKFAEFMEGYDEHTGSKRLDAFRQAEHYLDANRVADFFLEYKESRPRSKRETLEDHMTPDNTTGSNIPPSKSKDETFTARQVEDFFNDIARGVYRNKQKEADEIEAKITKAYVEGRII